MATKIIPDTSLDAQLAVIEGANVHVCEEPSPTNWAGIAAVELATQAMVGLPNTKADGDVSGRKTTFPAQTGVSITKSGTATSLAISDGLGELFAVTTVTSQALTSGGTVDIPAWDAEIGDPT